MLKGAFVCAYNPDAGTWLAQLRSKNVNFPLQWNFPGGGVEPNEDGNNAAQREFREEVGVEPPLNALKFVGVFGPPESRKALFTWRVNRVFQGATNSEVALHQWLPLGYLPSNSTPWMAELYEAAMDFVEP